MNDINSAILESLATGEKTRAQIAIVLNLHPPMVAGALLTLVNSGQVVVSGKVLVKRKGVSVYARSKGQPVPKQRPAKAERPPTRLDRLTDDEVAKLLNSNLYQIWGGYFPVDSAATKGLAVRRHTES